MDIPYEIEDSSFLKGIRGRNFLPFKNPYPCGGYGGYESDQISPPNTWTSGATMTDVKDSLLLQFLKYYLLVFRPVLN